ncbi:LPS translocon maturation chaperone LptM [Undibacterium seohonense]|uniref:LPS translocon maturation chaperone LptM n=1 Tax=Undibacterium seohonense TaxID=1344950 RepID=UPI001C9A46CC
MNKRTHISLLTTGLISISTVLLSACGQKGPLYMPEKKSANSAAATSPSPALKTPQATEPAK